jgi:nucleotide-binding universal stress UspA family protein
MTKHTDDGVTTLVVGHSRDLSSDHALAVAADLGRRLHARLHVVHMVDSGDYPIEIDGADWEGQIDQDLPAQRERVERILAGAGLGWTYEARNGNPAVELAQAAEEHQALLIVVGTRGEGLRVAITRLMLIEPSVSHRLIHRQHRPVLVVPAPVVETGTGAAPGDTGNGRSSPASTQVG